MPPRKLVQSEAPEEVSSILELSVRIVRSNRQIPFESKINIPIGDGLDYQPAMQSWMDMIAAGLKVQTAIRQQDKK